MDLAFTCWHGFSTGLLLAGSAFTCQNHCLGLNNCFQLWQSVCFKSLARLLLVCSLAFYLSTCFFRSAFTFQHWQSVRFILSAWLLLVGTGKSRRHSFYSSACLRSNCRLGVYLLAQLLLVRSLAFYLSTLPRPLAVYLSARHLLVDIIASI